LLSKSRSSDGRLWLPLFAWLLIIFLFSTDTFAGGETSRFIIPVLRSLMPWLDETQLLFMHYIIRKAGHVTEYFILAMLAWRTFSVSQIGWLRPKLFAAALVLGVALSDEFHQAFTFSRVGSFADIGYDCVGGGLALLLMPKSRHESGPLHSHSVL
jgi:VanZ family protein